MATINPELKAQLAAEPEQPVQLIVRTQGDAAPYLAWLADSDIEVTQQFRLTPGVAVSCTGAQALTLLDKSWVKSVEPDQTITTMQ